jgi:hypothetical protein
MLSGSIAVVAAFLREEVSDRLAGSRWPSHEVQRSYPVRCLELGQTSMLYKKKLTDTTAVLVCLKLTAVTTQGLTERVVGDWLTTDSHVVVLSEERLLVIDQRRT